MKLCLVCNFQFEDEQELCPKDYSKLVPLGKDQLIGKLIQDRYRVDALIAKGSMGMVYKATQELIGREVAVKVLHGYLVSDEESIKRFHKEAKAASRLNHPNITTLYDYGVLGSGQPYIVMDLLRGNSLAEILKQRDYLPLDEALIIFKQVCDALFEAHKRGVVHRDIKPENIMLEFGEKGINVKVVDFGIATFLQAEDDTIGKITKTGTVCGSPTYMSPEQCDDNRVDHRSDLYSLGIVVYETITGKVPFSGADIYGVMTMHVKDPVPPLRVARPDLNFPPYMEAVMQKALAKNPNDRFQNAVEFYDALRGKVPGQATMNQPIPAIASGGDTTGTLPGRPGMQNVPNSPIQPGAPVPVPGMPVGNAPSAGVPTGQTATITEAEVKSVVARALQKKMAQESGQAFEPQLDASGVPQVDPELVRKTVQAATLELQSRRSQSVKSRRTMRRDTTVPPAIRFLGFIQQFFPLFLTVALLGALFFVVRDEARMRQMFGNVAPPKQEAVQENPEDVDKLIAEGKLDQARAILETRKKDEGKLGEADQTTLNSVYLRMAKKEAKAKHFKQALSLVDLMTGEDKDDDEVRMLVKKWKKNKQ